MLVAALLTIGGCGEQSKVDEAQSPARTPEVMEIRGLVVDVLAKSLTTLQSLTIRDGGGMLWSFVADGPVGLTPSHLREHQAFGLNVTVRYRETQGGLLAVSVSD